MVPTSSFRLQRDREYLGTYILEALEDTISFEH